MVEADRAAVHNAVTKLRNTVAAFPGQGFAVLDGARFEDLPKLCRRERLFARSLFLDHADVEVKKAGPWLVGLGPAPDALDKVLALVDDEPAAVYWCCDGGEAVLYRHLRTLNMARIPGWAANGGTVPPADGSGREPAPVMFRHWDPRVLGALLPALDSAQFARVLGPGEEIAFLAHEYGGVRRVVGDPAFPPAPGGMLLIRSEQIEALNARRLSASYRRIAAALRASEPSVTSSIADAALLTHVQICDAEGRRLGLTDERAHGAWAYLMLMSNGRVARSREARDFIMCEGRSPDEQVGRLVAMRDEWREAAACGEAGHGGTV